MFKRLAAGVGKLLSSLGGKVSKESTISGGIPRSEWRAMRHGLPPMSGRQWVKLRKYMQREAKRRTLAGASTEQN